jgi:hypothetical protein
VTIAIPQDLQVKAIHLLVSGQTPRITHTNGSISVTLPSIVDHEVIAIDL